MHKVLMVQFQVNCIGPGLFIRALPVYCSMDFVNCPVVRCTVHSVEDDPAGQAHSQDGECQCGDYNLAGHVLRVCAFDAQYCYDGRSQRHSVRVPVASPQPGTNCMEVPYIFACKTSCVRGMQRRHINVVFTLETHKNDVIGRQVLSVKICSCPKRDKDRMEKALLESGANPNKQPIQSTSHRPILSPVPVSKIYSLYTSIGGELFGHPN
ncbi:hypothetical protein AAG570_001522 [Ranatra chinensis]|uniref:p53 DNA-binding domain-containing protein n=1 Tax=Ranatra chinensis TaxID=642074 RepID=A0ABD0YX38_9HEMI